MNRSSLSALIIWLLGIVMVTTLILNLPDGAMLAEYSVQAMVYAGLTAFTLYFGVLLTEGEFSTAHVIGIMAFLSLERQAHPVMIWAVFVGGLLGGLALVLRSGSGENLLRRRLTTRSATSIVVICARVTLSFLVGAAVYYYLNGPLPLDTPVRDAFGALVAFGLAYSVVYLAIFALETYSDGRSVTKILSTNWLVVAILLLLPVPFGMVAALLVNITPATLVIVVVGVVLLTLGLHAFSRTQYQLRKQLEELRSLNAVSQAMQSDLKLNSLLYAMYNQVAQLLHINHFVVALFERNARRLQFPLVIQNGQQITGHSQPWTDKTLLGRVLQKQSPLLISSDVVAKAKELGLEPPIDGLFSWLGVPLLAGGRLIGAMVVTSNDPQQTFSQDDLRLLNIVATNAGVAIDNAQLYEHQTVRANQLVTLNRILALLTGTLSPEEVIDAVLSSASVISEATALAVYLFWDEAHSTLALVRAAGLSDKFLSDPPTPLLTDLRQKPIVINNVETDKRAAMYRPVMAAEKKAAWVEMPLGVGETGLGTIIFYFNDPQEFSDDDIEVMRAFTNQAAQAIKNAQKYTTTDRALERRVEQMYALATLGRQLTATMNLRSICNLVLSRAMEVTQSGVGLITVYDEANQDWNVVAQSGYPPTMNLSSLLLKQSILGRVLESGQAIRANDVRTEHTEPALMYNGRSHLSVPILRSGQTLGAITLESDRVGVFSEEDAYFITQLANQTIIALDNTRLFERIAEARDRLQVILNAMTEGIVLVDRNGIIALANPRVDLIGLYPEQLLNQDIDALLEKPELDLGERMGFQSDQKVRKLLKEMRSPGAWTGIEPVSYTVEGEQGVLHIQRQVIPVGSENGEPIGMLLVFYNETEEKELAQMRDDLSSMIVHDLRSPLTAVTTGLKLLRDIVPQENALRPVIDSTADTSQRAIRKLLSRVDSLLDISRMESGQLNLDTEPTELATLADSVCAQLSPLAQDLEVTLLSQIDQHTPLLNIDSDKVERVIQNLVDNALKFCPSNGSVTIRASAPEARFVRVEVVDTGPGVPEDYKAKLFERFVQVKGRRGARRGIGLGLTFCRMVVEAHNGRIWIEDNPGGGSIFAFTLPVADMKRFDETGEFQGVPSS